MLENVLILDAGFNQLRGLLFGMILYVGIGAHAYGNAPEQTNTSSMLGVKEGLTFEVEVVDTVFTHIDSSMCVEVLGSLDNEPEFNGITNTIFCGDMISHFDGDSGSILIVFDTVKDKPHITSDISLVSIESSDYYGIHREVKPVPKVYNNNPFKHIQIIPGIIALQVMGIVSGANDLVKIGDYKQMLYPTKYMYVLQGETFVVVASNDF